MEIDDEMRRDLIDELNGLVRAREENGIDAEKAKDLKWRLENEKGIRQSQGRGIRAANLQEA